MRRGFQPPADLWGNVGMLVAEILAARMCDRPFGKIWVLGDLIFVVEWGRVYEIIGFGQLLLVNPPLQNYGDVRSFL